MRRTIRAALTSGLSAFSAFALAALFIVVFASPASATVDTVAFNSNGGAAVSALSGPPGSAITLPSDTRPGYTLYGWYTAASGGTIVGRAGWAYTIPSGGITLYAQWTSTTVDTVAFNSDGGAAVSALSGPPGSAITLPSDTRPGYTLYGWYTAASGGTIVGRAGWAYTIPSGGITLYAQWTSTTVDTVAFNSDGGAAVSALSGPPGSAITLPSDTRPGYTLYGWYTAASGGTIVGRAGWAYTIPSGGITLYAQWTSLCAAGLHTGLFCTQPTWTQLSPATSASGRYLAAMSYDSGTGQLVLFGGDGDGGSLNDTWTWNGKTWTRQSPATSPPGGASAMAYDSRTGQLLLFGGVDSGGNPLNVTWTWNGTTWTELFPAISPPADDGVGAHMVYDPGTGQLLLFGGFGGTWTWDGTTWTELSPTTSAPGYGLYGSSEDSIAYDPGTGQLVAYVPEELPFSGTWTWNGTTWTEVYQFNPLAYTGPIGRLAASMAYVPGTGLVLFGGRTGTTNEPYLLNDTWMWDGTTWTQLTPATSPAARQLSSMAYDPETRQLVLFGGFNDAIALDDTWVYETTPIVAFNSDGGAAVSALSGPPGSAITLPSDTRPGYTLYGWYTAASGGTIVGRAGWAYTIPSGGITLYAQWTGTSKLLINLWHTTNGSGYSVPTVSGQTLFVVAGNGTLDALDARTGRTEWSTGSDLDANVAPVVTGDIVIVTASEFSTLYAFDARTGRELWSKSVGLLSTTPIAAGGDVYIGEYYREIFLALDARTGKEVWSQRNGGVAIPFTPVISNGTIYLEDHGGSGYETNFNVVALNVESGVLAWGPVFGPGAFVVQGGVLYASGVHHFVPAINGVFFSQAFFALNATTGGPIWTDINQNVDDLEPPFEFAPPVVVDDSIIFAGLLSPSGIPSNVFAVDRASGKPLWTDNFAAGSGIGYRSIFYALLNGNALAALDPKTGSTYWTFPSQSLPVFDGDTAYVEGNDGSLYALDATSGGTVARSQSGSFSTLTAADGVVYSLSAGNLYAFALP